MADQSELPAPPGFQQIGRPGYGNSGAPCQLLCNHFRVELTGAEEVCQYDVTISFEDDPNNRALVRRSRQNRQIMKKLEQELGVKGVVFDGERNLYVLKGLPFKEREFKIALDPQPRPRGSPSAEADERSKKRRMDGTRFKVRVSFSTKVDMLCLQKMQTEQTRVQDALRVLDILLREQAAQREYVLLRESYFHESLGKVGDLGEGVVSWRGYHASFRPCVNGLSLNLDPSTTVMIKSQFVHEFLSSVLNKPPGQIGPQDMAKARRALKGIEVQAYTGTKHKIFGLSETPASLQTFEMKEKVESGGSTPYTTTVQDYYLRKYKKQLQFPGLHCVNVGKATRPVYIPMELCLILPGQRYKRKLTGRQTAKHINESRQKPNERIPVIQKGISELVKNAEAELKSFSVKIESRMLSVPGRVMPAPSLKFGRNDEVPRDGKWNYNTKTVAHSAKITNWVVVSFRNGEAQSRQIAMSLKQCCNRKGITIDDPIQVFVEQPRNAGRSPTDRVTFMRDEMRARLQKPPSFILCILPHKDSDLYAPFKRMCLTELGIVNQCIVPPGNLADQYLTNVALKINAKKGGYNSVLTKEFGKQLTKISERPTMILGMDVSHGSPGFSSTPSVAAIVSSRDWPRITQYAGRVATQPSRQETISNIDGMLGELVNDFVTSNAQHLRPQQMIIFRDGVSESQFESVLSDELQQVVKACQKLDFRPKLTLVVAQKRHHTRFFPAATGPDPNVSPGTVIDKVVTHPTAYDFYLSSQKGLIGTSRPTHYIVLYDEIGFTPDEIQNMVNQLCYTYVKSTTSISVVAPIYYAHLAAQKGRNFLAEEGSESGSSHRSERPGRATRDRQSVPPMPRLHANISSTMFFV